MRALVVSHLYPSPGVERHLFVHQQNLALRELGVDVRVIAPTPWAPPVLWMSTRHRRRGRKPRRAERDGILTDYPRILQPPRRLMFDRVGDLAAGRIARSATVRDGRFDVVHAHQALPDGAIAQRLADRLGVPFVVTVHGADVYQNLRRGGPIGQRTAAVLAAADAVMANSSAVARLLEPVVAGERLSVVLNGTTGLDEPVAPASDVLPDEPLILTVGYLIERKGHTYLLDALGRLAERGLRPHWMIVGEGPLQRGLAFKAATMELNDQVHFVGRRPHHRVLELMARAQLFALPSWDEAFGLVYTEAMAQGTPVLACRGEGPEDFVEHGVSGYLVPARDGQVIADVVEAVLTEPERAAAVGEAGRAAARGLTWRRNARDTLQVYERVLGAAGYAAPAHDAHGGRP